MRRCPAVSRVFVPRLLYAERHKSESRACFPRPPGFPPIYIAGLWIALACCLAFMGIYAFRVSQEARQLADALAATELAVTREQHLFALDGLAAAAAHSLGTPLATIAVVAKELEIGRAHV